MIVESPQTKPPEAPEVRGSRRRRDRGGTPPPAARADYRRVRRRVVGGRCRRHRGVRPGRRGSTRTPGAAVLAAGLADRAAAEPTDAPASRRLREHRPGVDRRRRQRPGAGRARLGRAATTAHVEPGAVPADRGARRGARRRHAAGLCALHGHPGRVSDRRRRLGAAHGETDARARSAHQYAGARVGIGELGADLAAVWSLHAAARARLAPRGRRRRAGISAATRPPGLVISRGSEAMLVENPRTGRVRERFAVHGQFDVISTNVALLSTAPRIPGEGDAYPSDLTLVNLYRCPLALAVASTLHFGYRVFPEPHGSLVAVEFADPAYLHSGRQASDVWLLHPRTGAFTHVPGFPILEHLKVSDIAWTGDPPSHRGRARRRAYRDRRIAPRQRPAPSAHGAATRRLLTVRAAEPIAQRSSRQQPARRDAIGPASLTTRTSALRHLRCDAGRPATRGEATSVSQLKTPLLSPAGHRFADCRSGLVADRKQKMVGNEPMSQALTVRHHCDGRLVARRFAVIATAAAVTLAPAPAHPATRRPQSRRRSCREVVARRGFSTVCPRPGRCQEAFADSSSAMGSFALGVHRKALAYFFAHLRAGHPTNPANKILWIVHPPRGSDLVDPSPPARRRPPACHSPAHRRLRAGADLIIFWLTSRGLAVRRSPFAGEEASTQSTWHTHRDRASRQEIAKDRRRALS